MVKASATKSSIKFIDLDAQRERLGTALQHAILSSVDAGQYIMGAEVAELEEALAHFAGVRHVVSCANGTDAIIMGLMGCGVKSGDAVICPAFTFAATAGAIALAGATPVFCDVDPLTYNCTAADVEEALTHARQNGLEVVGLLAVDLFGQPADYSELQELCTKEKIWLACDAAQSFGASQNGVRVGGFGRFTTTSFFPAKPLGCYGDGGSIMTNDEELANIFRSLRLHGKGSDKYQNIRVGLNSRLDTIQAAILLQKLTIFQDEIDKKAIIASRYNNIIPSSLIRPALIERTISTWAQYTVKIPNNASRVIIQERLRGLGVPTHIYYPTPLHQQQAYAKYTLPSQSLNSSEALSAHVLSLPMHPYLTNADQNYISNALKICIDDSAILRNKSVGRLFES